MTEFYKGYELEIEHHPKEMELDGIIKKDGVIFGIKRDVLKTKHVYHEVHSSLFGIKEEKSDYTEYHEKETFDILSKELKVIVDCIELFIEEERKTVRSIPEIKFYPFQEAK